MEKEVLETLLKRPEHFEELENAVMTNCDHSIDHGIAEQLKTGDFFAQYAGWNFCGYVWYGRDAGQWNCEVWQYHSHMDTVTADTLEAIMEQVCEKYGHD